MRSGWWEWLKALVTIVILAAIWLAYSQYFVFKNPDNTYDFMVGENAVMALVFASLITISCLSVMGFYINKWFSNRSAEKITSRLARDLTRLYLSDDFVDYVGQFGMVMEYDKMTIKPEILSDCSLSDLARLMIFLFHKNALQEFDFQKIFCSLADLILDAWAGEIADEFVMYVYKADVVLGEQLRYVIERKKIDREVEQFNQNIKNRLAEVEKTCSDKRQEVTIEINSCFEDYDYLTNGGSVFWRWLVKKLNFSRFWKPSMA